MSSKKLLAATAGRYEGPFFPDALKALQKFYETKRHRVHPITLPLLDRFAEFLRILFKDVRVDQDFVTGDGTHWIGVSFLYVSGAKYKILFPKDEDPKHHDGTVSSQHVAIYCMDESTDQEQLSNVAQAASVMFSMAFRDFDHK